MNPGQGAALKLSDAELLAIHRARGQKILQIAAAHGTDTLILGAFGCGAFQKQKIRLKSCDFKRIFVMR
ncbi:MAG: hypothetical protein HDT33_01660 [Clostridiales bacterium]|nr:hypothetical protein [Clostridiales bacterium]